MLAILPLGATVVAQRSRCLLSVMRGTAVHNPLLFVPAAHGARRKQLDCCAVQHGLCHMSAILCVHSTSAALRGR